MNKPTRYHKVISCSGMTDPDMPSLAKCPFYDDEYGLCALTGDYIESAMIVPDDCILRGFDVEVYTEVLSQQELELDVSNVKRD